MLRNWQEKARPANRVAQFLRIVAVVSPWHYTQNRWITWRVVGQPETGPGRLLQGCPSDREQSRSLPICPLLIPPGKLDSFRLAIREWIDSVNTTAFSFCSG